MVHTFLLEVQPFTNSFFRLLKDLYRSLGVCIVLLKTKTMELQEFIMMALLYTTVWICFYEDAEIIQD